MPALAFDDNMEFTFIILPADAMQETIPVLAVGEVMLHPIDPTVMLNCVGKIICIASVGIKSTVVIIEKIY